MRFDRFEVEDADEGEDGLVLRLVFDSYGTTIAIPFAADVDVDALYAELCDGAPDMLLREFGIRVNSREYDDDRRLSYRVSVGCTTDVRSPVFEFSLDDFEPDDGATLFNPHADRWDAFCQQLLDALSETQRYYHYYFACVGAPECLGCCTMPTGPSLASKAPNNGTALTEWCPRSARLLRALEVAAVGGAPRRFRRLPAFVYLDPPPDNVHEHVSAPHGAHNVSAQE